MSLLVVSIAGVPVMPVVFTLVMSVEVIYVVMMSEVLMCVVVVKVV